MQLKARQITRGVLEVISDALKDEAPEEGRRAWIGETADEIGVGESSLKDWLYGRGAPGLPGFLALVARFGPRFGDKILAPIGYRLVRIEGVDAYRQLRERP